MADEQGARAAPTTTRTDSAPGDASGAGPGSASEPPAERAGQPGPGLVVALDGPASSGKSTVGEAAARALGYRFCDTGLLYRALAWLALERGVALDDDAALVALVPEIELADDGAGRFARVAVGGRDVTALVRDERVDRVVSDVARRPAVRAALLERQRALAAGGRIIMAGRDIGTVVLPDADLKLYLDASPEERARRRAAERGLAPDSEAGAAILAELRRRDAIDRGRAVAPLRAAPDATVLATDGRRFEETVAAVVAAIRAVEAKRAAARRASGGEEMAAADRDPRSTADRDPARPSHLSPLIRLGAAGARLLARLLARVTIDGDPRSLPRAGPLILAANHLSNLDGVVVGGWLTPALGRRIHWLAKKEMLGWPIAGRLLAMSSFHAVDRGRGDVEAFRTAQRILEAGNVLFVFPEGTRSRTGALGRAQEGLAALALRTDAPIVPLAIWGTERVWPRGRLPRPGGHVVLRIGAPFRLSELGLRGVADRRAAKAAATEAIMARIARLLPEAYRGVYAGAADDATAERVSTPGVQ